MNGVALTALRKSSLKRAHIYPGDSETETRGKKYHAALNFWSGVCSGDSGPVLISMAYLVARKFSRLELNLIITIFSTGIINGNPRNGLHPWYFVQVRALVFTKIGSSCRLDTPAHGLERSDWQLERKRTFFRWPKQTRSPIWAAAGLVMYVHSLHMHHASGSSENLPRKKLSVCSLGSVDAIISFIWDHRVLIEDRSRKLNCYESVQ